MGRGSHGRVPRHGVRKTELFPRWGAVCCYCDEPAQHVDHVAPLSKGGRDVLSNSVPACADCNLAKGSLTLAQWAATF
ncbi:MULTISPECIES: HNH endonuclease [Streptomyces]|uniref:HNH endonuclease n=1 Tax=Streptomyces TaxID=1883 RepID=UPI0033F47774